MDSATLSAAAIATLVITKAFEKIGEKLGEKAVEQGDKLVQLLQERFPSTATALASVEEQPKDWGEAVLEVEAATETDPEVAQAVREVATAAKENSDSNIIQKLQAIEDAIKSQQPTNRQEFRKVVELIEKAIFGNSLSYRFSIIIEKDEDGYYAYCPDLPGCQSEGDSLEEVRANIKEAVELYLETLSESEKQALLKREILTMTLEVQVA